MRRRMRDNCMAHRESAQALVWSRWRLNANGSYVFFVRSSWKPIECEKGKPAIAVPSLDKMPAVIDTFITAVRNGELDEQLAPAKKPPAASKSREVA
jgi:hypothetical protein